MFAPKLSILVAVNAAVVLPVLAQQTNSVEELEFLQKSYRDQIDKIEEKYVPIQADAVAEYEKQLAVAEQSLIKKGDLESVLAVRKEKERFKQAETLGVPDDAIVKAPPELNAAQMKFKTVAAKILAGKQTEKTRLTSAFIERLETLKGTLTKSSRIEDAVLVKAEIEKAKKTLASISSAVAGGPAAGATESADSEAGGKTAPKTGSGAEARSNPREDPSSPQRKGLILYYTFDDADPMADKSGQTNNATMTGRARPVPGGVVGKAMSFGGQDRLNTPKGRNMEFDLGAADDKTIAFWWKTDKLMQSCSFVSRRIQNKQKYLGMAFGIETVEGNSCYQLAAGPNVWNSAWDYQNNRWYHVVITKSGPLWNVYHNGEGLRLGTKIDPYDAQAADTQMSFGRDPFSSNGLKGELDEIMIFNRALSDAEVAELYKSYGQ